MEGPHGLREPLHPNAELRERHAMTQAKLVELLLKLGVGGGRVVMHGSGSGRPS